MTGGGTAGHVTPNIALIPYLRADGWEIHYIGSKTGIEYSLLKDVNGVNYHHIPTGKMRRYFDIKNFTDPFLVGLGIIKSIAILNKIHPDIIFSKGGFVAVPPLVAAKILKIPSLLHESDMTPGLANKLTARFAKLILTTFPETVEYFGEDRAVCTGTPIRPELSTGSASIGRSMCGFSDDKPVVMVMGGSQGAGAINDKIREIIERLTVIFNVIHLCGKNNVDSSLETVKGYKQFEYISSEMPHIFAAADMAVSRAGSNSINEFLSLKIPMLLIPLPLSQSRGDQIDNAKSFEKQGFCSHLPEDGLTGDKLYDEITALYENKQKYIDAMDEVQGNQALPRVLALVKKYAL